MQTVRVIKSKKIKNVSNIFRKSKTAMARLKKVCGGILSVFGIALFVIGIALKWAIFPKLVEDQVYENLKLKDGSEGWKAFVSTSFQIRFLFIDCTYGTKYFL